MTQEDIPRVNPTALGTRWGIILNDSFIRVALLEEENATLKELVGKLNDELSELRTQTTALPPESAAEG